MYTCNIRVSPMVLARFPLAMRECCMLFLDTWCSSNHYSISPCDATTRIAHSLAMGSPENDLQIARNNHHETQQLLKVNSNSDLTFEEMRALVCTTFLGEPSQEMASFKQWLHNTPVAASKIAVEGMFHGPPTVLLVSMPIAVGTWLLRIVLVPS